MDKLGYPFELMKDSRASYIVRNFSATYSLFTIAIFSIGEDDYRGGEGPLHVSRGTMSNPLHQAFLEAGKQAGYQYVDDLNGYQQEGKGQISQILPPCRILKDHQQRMTSFLQMIIDHRLTVIMHCTIIGITLSGWIFAWTKFRELKIENFRVD